MGSALEGVRVVDMTQVLSGPHATKILGDLGAEVIKIEQPNVGDIARKFAGPSIRGESGYFLAVNRNKQSVTLNLKTTKGREILKELVKISDIVVENFRVGTTKRIGLDYKVLSEINPMIIYCTLSGYGSTGPYKDHPVFDYIIQSLGGVMSIVGEFGGPPVHTGFPIADLSSGTFAATGILAALHAREKTGKGRYIDISMLDVIISLWTYMGQFYLLTGDIPVPMDSRHVTNVPQGAFKTKDGYLVITCAAQNFYENLVTVISKELKEFKGLPKDVRFSTPSKRLENRNELEKILGAVFSKKERDEWCKILEEGDVPVAPVNNVSEAFNNPQILSRNMIVEFDHPVCGKIKTLGNPIKMSETPKEVFISPPLLGQHNEEIICGLLGYSKRDLKKFKKDKVI
jgi:crotonobetainyl-CoA:carnitine CoA-transferase CaiB-like acyl-CoA transferase